ncbi:MAG TPA: hypothetical protein VHY18_11675 [Solirubrobacteraceae bacterium]|nr:hypothetical protein [Solirubrobacteraceae bacterium]
MSSEQQPQPSATGTQGAPGVQGPPGGPTDQAQPSEDELRAAYEAELNRITSAEMIIQTTVSLINIGGRRLGLAPSAAGADPSATPGSERDLEQVRDAIDGASALMPILERRMPGELAPLRDAIAQLQVAYAREAQSSSNQTSTTPTTVPDAKPEQAKPAGKAPEGDVEQGPGPAQASGRLWVPGR